MHATSEIALCKAQQSRLKQAASCRFNEAAAKRQNNGPRTAQSHLRSGQGGRRYRPMTAPGIFGIWRVQNGAFVHAEGGSPSMVNALPEYSRSNISCTAAPCTLSLKIQSRPPQPAASMAACCTLHAEAEEVANAFRNFVQATE